MKISCPKTSDISKVYKDYCGTELSNFHLDFDNPIHLQNIDLQPPNGYKMLKMHEFESVKLRAKMSSLESKAEVSEDKLPKDLSALTKVVSASRTSKG